MYLLKFIIFGTILVGYQTLISNADVQCYACNGDDDEKLHWRGRDFSVNKPREFYPPKCSSDEIDQIENLDSIDCEKGCGVVKLTRFDEKGK